MNQQLDIHAHFKILVDIFLTNNETMTSIETLTKLEKK